MSPRRVGAGLGLAAVAAVALAMAGGEASPPVAPEAQPVMLPEGPTVGGYSRVLASPAPASGIGHSRPPDPEALRDAPDRQAAYDAEARPGEFVTPPNVSIDH